MKTILVDAVYVFVLPGTGIDQALFAFLESFPHKKILLTSANSEQKKEFGLVDMPYDVFSLAGDPPKSNPLYYTKMLQHYGLSADDVVYFEHNQEAVKSSQSVGIPTYWYDTQGKDLAGLKQFFAEHGILPQ